MNRVSSIFSQMLKLVPAPLFLLLSERVTSKLTQAERAHRLRLPKRLLRLDSSIIDLCASIFKWAKYPTAKGAVKLHVKRDHDGLLPHYNDGLLPHYAVISDGKTSEIAVARNLDLPTGSMRIS